MNETWFCEKFLREPTPLGQKGLPHFTQAQSNRNKDFVVWFWILPERPLLVPPDKGNEGSKRDWRPKQISGKIDALVF